MAKYQQYAEYKDSGVEWLGEVPSDWDVVKIKHLSSVKRGASPRPIDDPKFFDDYGDYAWVRIADVSASDMYLLNTTQTMSALGSSLSVKLEPNELFLSIAGTVGKPCINKIKACIHDGFVYFPDLKIPNKYLFYIFAGEQAYKGLGKMGTQLNLNTDTVGDIKVALPKSKIDVQGIIDFLDHETAKIDSLIEKQQQLIQLLKEKRQAVISHAVTKGLNPNVPMKDSGVEWLGEVPEHWQFPRLKQLIQYGSSISYGIVQPGDALDEGVPFIQTTNISKGSFELEDFQKTSVSIESNYPRSRLEGGEVILGIRASIGAAFVVPMSFKGVNLSRGIARIIPNNLLRSDFLVWYFKSNTVDQYWGLSKQGSTFSEVSIETVRELNVVIPPLDEQETITKYLTDESNKFEKLINFAEKQKLLLLERRTALISAAVTGKIDVRNWQNPNKNNEAKTEFSA